MKRVAEAPTALALIDVVATALEAVEFFSPERHDYARQRQRIVAANVELQERELMELALLSPALAEVLRGHGVGDPAAGLTADAGMAVFKVAFEYWIDETNQQDFRQLVRTALDELRALIAR